MSVTVEIAEGQSIRVVEDRIETQPPDRLAFEIEGVLSMTDQLLAQFEGTTLKPSQIEISTGDAESVEIDLTEEPSLRLTAMDVGVQTPDSDDLSEGIDTLRSTMGDPTEIVDAKPAALAFTVEGSILDVSEETFDTLTEGDVSIETLSFAVEDAKMSDGGSADDVMLEIGLLGYGITVRRDGTVTIGIPGVSAGTGLL
ncbi:hypothetical protein [Natrarchaeobius chitinivorans]|uniref:Uncharacterized protein n=1 Tax=Natrarchaeobius chitinivorans TaxID=1679083 RepID=A0A3N6MDA4_NATCH|nr:hypothetical protein [Natrarchaeobius chitinivorans]RQG94590.1 hypothetical protein EA473_10910 [Natrarchaeobius chitinivorans]